MILRFLAAAAGAMAVATMSLAAPPVIVTTGADDGEGSLRQALARGATEILISPSVDTISITETLVYDEKEPLHITGTGQTVDGSALRDSTDPLLHITKGADLHLSKLTFDAGGTWSRSNGGGGEGIYVEVPEKRKGTVTVALSWVTVTGTGNHGVHVSDCSLRNDCGSGVGGGGDGSPATIRMYLVGVRIERAGLGIQDADGIRIDERGDGHIEFYAALSHFENNGGDGLELDEGNAGSVHMTISDTSFRSNGDFCYQADLEVFPQCDDDGEVDVEDGFDADEAGPGGLFGSLTNVTASGSYDEDLDFDEQGKDEVLLQFFEVRPHGGSADAPDSSASIHASLNGTALTELISHQRERSANGAVLTGVLAVLPERDADED